MIQKNHGKCLIVCLAVVFLSTFSLNAYAGTTVVKIGTGVLSGNYFPTGGAIAKIVNEKEKAHSFRCAVESTDGSISNIDGILSGKFEFGIVQSDNLYSAVKGMGEWKTKGPQSDLRALFGLHTEAVTLVASGASGIRTVQDLKGRSVHIGHPGSGGRRNAVHVLDTAGINWKKDIAAFGKTRDVPRLLFEGKIDAFFQTVGHPSHSISYATLAVPGTRIIPITNIEKILSNRPYYAKATIPMRLYPGVIDRQDVETFGVKATLVTSAKTPDHVVYAITKEIFENLETFRLLYPHLQMLSDENMLECLTAMIHPGAMKYYNEADVKLPPSCLVPK